MFDDRRTGAWRESFAAAQPFRHVVMEDFLDAALCRD
jgi:hypothetical protein